MPRAGATPLISLAPRFRWTLICFTEWLYIEHLKPDSGSAPRTGGRLTHDAEFARSGKGRWSAKRKLSVVLELLRGADLESTSRKYGLTVAALSQWREAFLAAGEAGLQIRQEDLAGEQARRMKSVIAELAMENELLQERIRRMEDEKPFLRWRSKR
jgi:hypothetical protein